MIILARASCTVTVVADGRGVDYTKQQYRLSLSKTELSDGEDWSDTYPLDTGGMYVWVRTLTKYSDSDVPEVSDMYCTFNVVDTIKIGAENLLNNSLFKRGLDKWNTNGGANSIVDDTRFGKALKIDTSGGGYGVYQVVNLEPNTQHTVAIWLKSETADFEVWFGFGENFTTSVTLSTTWKKYTVTATSASGDVFTMYHRENKGVAYYAQPHLVEGNKIVENFSESEADKQIELEKSVATQSGMWKQGATYVGSSSRRDVVLYVHEGDVEHANSGSFRAKTTAGTFVSNTAPYADTTHFEAYGAYSYLTASGLALFEKAIIENLVAANIETVDGAPLQISTEDNEIKILDDDGRVAVNIRASNFGSGETKPCNYPTTTSAAKGGIIVGGKERLDAISPTDFYVQSAITESGLVVNAYNNSIENHKCFLMPYSYMNFGNTASLVTLQNDRGELKAGQTILTGGDAPDFVLGQYVQGGVFIEPRSSSASNKYNNVQAGLVAKGWFSGANAPVSGNIKTWVNGAYRNTSNSVSDTAFFVFAMYNSNTTWRVTINSLVASLPENYDVQLTAVTTGTASIRAPLYVSAMTSTYFEIKRVDGTVVSGTSFGFTITDLNFYFDF